MYRMPSARKGAKKNKFSRINLVPILDAIFIFIFFLLSSANFIEIFEVHSMKPMVSDKMPPDKKVPLALTLEISKDKIQVMTGIPSRVYAVINRNGEDYDYEKLHQIATDLKKKHVSEKSVVLNPLQDIPYKELILIIDALRVSLPTDEAIFEKLPDGTDAKVEVLFPDIIFGNLLS